MKLNSVSCVDESFQQLIKIEIQVVRELGVKFLKLNSDIEFYNKIINKIFSSIYCEALA